MKIRQNLANQLGTNSHFDLKKNHIISMSNKQLEKRNEKKGCGDLYSLIPLEEFKAVLGIDDRDDRLSAFCLVTATHTIEQHCMRRLLRKRHFERIEFAGDLFLSLRHYPVDKITAVYLLSASGGSDGELLDEELYEVFPDCGCGEDIPFALALSPAIKRVGRFDGVRVIYAAGYSTGNAPLDLASACLELAAWNMNRYKGRKIGITGNGRGQGERLELAMPENVLRLLEAYRRKVI